ncbi:MAG TPA: NADH:flavin oxidoreductase [Desulfatiglandales bacterium]|nr:NADH:flavin oxidoreductase [Desulfatiglandales bacterium]
MTTLFTPSEINGMTISNRFVRSATWSGMATDDGASTPQLVDLISDLAKGGVGLIITGHAYVQKDGQAGPWQLGIYKDELISGLKTISQAVHESGGKIILELAHAGFYAQYALTRQTPLAPSNIDGLSKKPRKEMRIQDIKEMVNSFGEAARRAKNAGFDGVQIHSAHGYLLSQFLSPFFNRRTDEYGGKIQNRARILLEVLETIRNVVGWDYPILVKLNSQDFIENGLKLEDSIRVGTMLSQRGIDGIELSGGLLTSSKFSPSRRGITSKNKEAYFRDEAQSFKEAINVPLILVGGIRSYNVADQLIDEGVADYISMCRPFIREPDLINRWKAGDLRKAACISDNKCFSPAMDGEGIYCVTEKKKKDLSS